MWAPDFITWFAMNKILLISFATLLVGCVGHYQQPSVAAPHATLDAKWGSNELISGGFQGYWAYYNANCLKAENGGVLGGISKSDAAEKPFFNRA